MSNFPPPTSTDTVTAYSYMRFSHPDQARGDSLRRQRDLRNAWLKNNPGVVLDTSLMMTDRGKSAYGGDDREGLTTFVDLVKAGRIARGSFLIIENLDRLSRDKIPTALRLILDLIGAGVRIVQLTPVEMLYDEKSAGENPMAILMMMIMELQRGHSESDAKSKRIGSVWAQKKRLAAEKGTPVSTQGPAWLRLVDGQWELIPSAVETVRRIFRLATDGHGISQITKMLNAEGVPAFGAKERYQVEEVGQRVDKWRAAAGGRWGAGCWRQPYVSLIVSDRRVIGEYQPHRYSGKSKVKDGAPVKDYYPGVLSEQEWHAARQSIEGRRRRVGRIGKVDLNVFNGLLHDGTDGGTLHVVDKGAGRKCLVSSKSRDGVAGSQYVTFPLPVFEQAVLAYLEEVDPADVFPQEREPDLAVVLEGRIRELRAELALVKTKLKDKYSDTLADVAAEHEATLADLTRQLDQKRREAAPPLRHTLEQGKDLIKVLADPEARVRLRTCLRRIVTGIFCVFASQRTKTRLAAVQIHFVGGGYRDVDIFMSVGRGVEGRDPSDALGVSLVAGVGRPGIDGPPGSGSRPGDPVHAGALPARNDRPLAPRRAGRLAHSPTDRPSPARSGAFSFPAPRVGAGDEEE